jgi:predicted DCC family thiol-disulfide oxidoreductase YuxK
VRLTLLYDGDCSFCQRSARRAAAWSASIEPLPLQNPTVATRFPHVSLQAALESMHVIREDGLTAKGARAWRLLAARGPWFLRLAAMTFVIPGVPQVAELVYGWIARNRVRRGTMHRECASGACRVEPGMRAEAIRSQARDAGTASPTADAAGPSDRPETGSRRRA